MPFAAIALAFLLLALRGVADDQIVKTDGTVLTGRITGVSTGQVMLESRTSSGGVAKIPYYLADIKTITMAAPDAVMKVQAHGTPPGTVIAALEPPVKQFAGLPVGWVVDAMAQLGDAYSQVGQVDKAMAIYNEIGTLYPGSAYENVAKASRAEMSLNSGKIDDALAMVQPIVDAANKNMAPSPVDGATFAKAFLVRGRIFDAQNKPQLALEDFLTVKTMFYQNANLVAEADHYATDLRAKMKDKDPGFGID